jgi:hypothetical protein
MYVSGSDWGYINGAGAPQGSATGQLQRLDTLAGTILRIDPRSPTQTGGQHGIGDYTIPANNAFVDGNPNTEVAAQFQLDPGVSSGCAVLTLELRVSKLCSK